MSVRSLVACACLLTGVAACADDPEPSGPGVTSRIGTFEYPYSGRDDVDVLFVIDSSTAMAPYRAQVVAQIPQFVDVLADVKGGMPDVNIAVTTTDFAAGGAFRTSSRIVGTDTFLSDGWRDGARVQNYTGELRTAVAELADVGAAGTAANRPLDVLPLALGQTGFLRPSSYVAIVVITATEDASTAVIDTLVTQIKAMHADPLNFILFGIYLKPAARLDQFFSSFPNRNYFTALDAANISAGFAAVLQLQRTTLGAPCFEFQPVDVDPATPGEQYECVIEDIDNATHESTLVPRCGDGAFPCWDMVHDPMICMTTPSMTFKFDRGDTGRPYEGGVVRGQCLVE